MARNPTDRRYTADHEWARAQGKVAVVGITDFAQDQLGDVVYLELPKVGQRVKSGESFGVVESTKAVSELFAPVSGTVVGVNGPLLDKPEAINKSPYGDGWMIEIEMANPADLDPLMTAEAYEAHLKEQGH